MTTTAHPPLSQMVAEMEAVSVDSLANIARAARLTVQAAHGEAMDTIDMATLRVFLVSLRNQAIDTVTTLDHLVELTKLDRRSVN